MTDVAVAELYGDDDKGPGVRYVVRLSRTSTGQRTYTVGLTLPEAYPVAALGLPDGRLHSDGDAIARLFAIEDAVRYLIDHERPGTPVTSKVLAAAAPTVGSRAVRMMARGVATTDGWYTFGELLTGTGASGSQLRVALTREIEAGRVEVQRGGGKGRQSRYRLIEPVSINKVKQRKDGDA